MPKRAVRLFLKLIDHFGMSAFAFKERTDGGSNLCPECLSKWSAANRIGTLSEKETYQRGIPAEKNIGKRNRLQVRTMSEQQLHKIDVCPRHCTSQRCVFHCLIGFVSNNQFDHAVKSGFECDLKYRLLALSRHPQRLARSNPFLDIVKPSSPAQFEEYFALFTRQDVGHSFSLSSMSLPPSTSCTSTGYASP